MFLRVLVPAHKGCPAKPLFCCCIHTRTFDHRVAHWLLQRTPGACAETDVQQTATSVECRSPCGQQYQQVRPRLVTILHTELHWLDVPGRVMYKLGVMVFNCLRGQASPYLVELWKPVAGVASWQHLRSAAAATVPPAQLLWPTGFLCGWSISLEFPTGQLAESDYWREQFQTISEDVSVRNVLMHSAH